MDSAALKIIEPDRKTFLGGSDAPGVLGLSRWQTPLQVWAEKTGQIIPEDISEKLHVKLGTRLEEVVAELFTEKTGLKVRRVNERQVHPQYPFLVAQIDRYVVGDDSLLECKTASAWKAKEWQGEEIPQEYIVQVMHQLAVTGKRTGYIAVLIGNQDFKIKEIKRDEKTINQMVAREVAFWNDFVIPKVMPGIITKNDADVLYELFPLADAGSVMDLGDRGSQIIENRNALIQDKINLEEMVERMENELRAMLGETENGTAGKWRIKWANQSQVRLDSARIKEEAPELYQRFGKETKFRKLSIKEASNGKH